MIHINIPVKDASFNGAVEKDIIPSKDNNQLSGDAVKK